MSMLSKKPVAMMAAAGAIGGFLGFALTELGLSHDQGPARLGELILTTATWSALNALVLGSLLLVAQNVAGLRGRWNRDLAWVPFASCLTGGFAGGVAQFLYVFVPPNPLTRGLAWALMGTGFGIILGIADKSKIKARRAALGGLAGGFVGGLVFDFVNAVLHFGEQDTGSAARAVGLTVLGLAIGAALQLSQELFKTAWILGTTSGPYEGKEYILTKPVVTVGRSDRNDVCLFRAADLPEAAGALQLVNGVWFWTGMAIPVNGSLATNASLNPGDRLLLGRTEFLFQTREAVDRVVSSTRWLLHGDSVVLKLPPGAHRMTLGAASHCDLVVPGAGVEAHHATLFFEGGALFFEPVSYSAVTRVNDQPVPAGQRRPLQRGDLVRLGNVELAVLTE